VGVGGDRGQVHRPEVVPQVQIADQEVVGEGLLDLGEQLAFAQSHPRPRGGVGIGQDVEGVNAVPAVGLDPLEHQARCQAEALGGGDPDSKPPAGAVAGVHVLVDPEVRLYRVHPAAQLVAVAHHPECRFVAERHVEAQLGAVPWRAAVNPIRPHLAERSAHAKLGWVADVAHRAGQRAGAEQGPLGTPQHFHPGDVEEIKVRGKQGQGHRGVVQVGADLLLDPGLIPCDLAGGRPAHGNLALARSQVLHAEPGHVEGDGLDIVHPAHAEDFFAGGGDREGHGGQRLLAQHGRDGDLLQHQGLQGEVHRDRRSGCDLNVSLGRPPLARQRSDHGIRARGEAGNGVTAVRSRHGGPGSARGLVRGGDGGSPHRVATGASHRAGDPAA